MHDPLQFKGLMSPQLHWCSHRTTTVSLWHNCSTLCCSAELQAVLESTGTERRATALGRHKCIYIMNILSFSDALSHTQWQYFNLMASLYVQYLDLAGSLDVVDGVEGFLYRLPQGHNTMVPQYQYLKTNHTILMCNEKKH